MRIDPCSRRSLRLVMVSLLMAELILGSSRCSLAAPFALPFNHAAREEAIRSLPFAQLTEETQARLTAVVYNPTIFRRMPEQVIHCDPDMYWFLLRYPEVVVNIWRSMGITKCSAKRTGPYSFAATDGVGTQTHIELVYGSADTHVIYAEGTYEGPLLKRKITGRCVLLLKSNFTTDGDGRTLVSNRMDVFLQLDNVATDLIAKTLQPVVGKSADSSFVQSAQFVSQISGAAEGNGPGMQRLAERLDQVDPRVRQRFAEIAAIVNHRASLRESSLAVRSALPAGEVPNSVHWTSTPQ